MSASKVGLRWFRVYSANRETRKAVGASTLKEFVTEAKKKLQLKPSTKITVVLEEDGTIVDDEEYFQQGIEQNDILMVLKPGEEWTGCYNLVAVPDEELDAPDGASGADAAVNDGSELRLQELASRLRADLKQLLLFDVSDHQVIVDADCTRLSRLLHRTRLETERIQSTCQRYVDEHAEFKEACAVMKLAKDCVDSRTSGSASADEVDAPGRKRKRAK